MVHESSELETINAKMSRIVKQVTALQEHIDDITFSEEDKAAYEAYRIDKAGEKLVPFEEVDRMLGQ